MNQDNRYDNYTQLLGKVEALFHAVVSRHPVRFSCAKGCYGCCQPGLTVFSVEMAYINSWIEKNKDVALKIKDTSQMLMDPSFCRLLDKNGDCSIYEARPMICRSHGMPISWAENGADQSSAEERDVCPLNFQGVDLNSLDRSDVLSLDKLNVLLSLIDRQFDPDNAGARHTLDELAAIDTQKR